MTTTRLGGWAGIVFSILSLIVIPLVAVPAAPLPVLGSDGGVFVAWFSAHKTGFLVGNYLGIAAFVPGFVQLAVLVALVRQREGADGWLSALVLGTGTFTYAVFACSLVAFQLLPFLVNPAAAEPLGWLASVWFSLDGLAALSLTIAVAIALRKTEALPSWLVPASWLTAAACLLMSLGSLTATPAWLAAGGPVTFLGFVAFFSWTGALGVAMLRRPR